MFPHTQSFDKLNVESIKRSRASETIAKLTVRFTLEGTVVLELGHDFICAMLRVMSLKFPVVLFCLLKTNKP